MKHHEIEIDKIYWMAVGGKSRCVRITGHAPGGGWYALNLYTGRTIIVRTAKRLERECIQPTAGLPFGWTDEVIVTISDEEKFEKVHCRHPGGECSLEQFNIEKGLTLGEWLKSERPGMKILSFRPIEPVK